MMYAGATAVEIGTAQLINPLVIPEIIKDLNEWSDKFGPLKDIIGRSHNV